jgi:hypothetical protein
MSIPEEFERQARAVLANHPDLHVRWAEISKGRGRELFIPKQDSSGFDVRVQAEEYGLYPFADDWHGAPWELSAADSRPVSKRVRELCSEFLGFVRTMLSVDATLHVHYAGRRPYRWVLSFETELGRESEEFGLLFYNYFGKRRLEPRQNRHLPSRYNAT